MALLSSKARPMPTGGPGSPTGTAVFSRFRLSAGEPCAIYNDLKIYTGNSSEADMLNIHASYFSIANPIVVLDRWLHPPRHARAVTLRGQPMQVEWTHRAERALGRRERPLYIEMQLYFTCVVQKRVLFHDTIPEDALPVTDKLSVDFRPVESESCDPVEFARSHPVRREFGSKGATRMHPKTLLIDYRNGEWIGEYSV